VVVAGEGDKEWGGAGWGGVEREGIK